MSGSWKMPYVTVSWFCFRCDRVAKDPGFLLHELVTHKLRVRLATSFAQLESACTTTSLPSSETCFLCLVLVRPIVQIKNQHSSPLKDEDAWLKNLQNSAECWIECLHTEKTTCWLGLSIYWCCDRKTFFTEGICWSRSLARWCIDCPWHNP